MPGTDAAVVSEFKLTRVNCVLSAVKEAAVSTNAPESEAVTLDDTAVFDAAREAIMLLKKTFETWLVIGKAVVRARDIADRRGDRQTFMRLIEQQGLSKIVDKSTASRLLRIMDPENLPEIMRWHQSLTEKQQYAWAAPTAIMKHCPVFAVPKGEQGEPKPSAFRQLREAHMAVLQENHRLKQREDGDRFKPTDTAEDIATVLVSMFSPNKAQTIARLLLAKLKSRKEPAATRSRERGEAAS
jgi:hypothetical protein